MTVIIHRKDPLNTGDLTSNPALYHDFLSDAKVFDITSSLWQWKVKDQNVILGGGGMLYAPWSPMLKSLIDAPWKSLTLWGIGSNNHIRESTPWDSSFAEVVDELVGAANLVGLRDMQLTNEWVPCASVAHQFFSDVPEPTHDRVAYQHREERFQFNTDLPSIAADSPLDDCLNHIASGRQVASSSYHGCLWAAMMERESIAVNPFSTKFKTALPSSVNHHIDFDNEFDFAPIDTNFRLEALERNQRFADSVKRLLRA